MTFKNREPLTHSLSNHSWNSLFLLLAVASLKLIKKKKLNGISQRMTRTLVPGITCWGVQAFGQNPESICSSPTLRGQRLRRTVTISSNCTQVAACGHVVCEQRATVQPILGCGMGVGYISLWCIPTHQRYLLRPITGNAQHTTTECTIRTIESFINEAFVVNV